MIKIKKVRKTRLSRRSDAVAARKAATKKKISHGEATQRAVSGKLKIEARKKAAKKK